MSCPDYSEPTTSTYHSKINPKEFTYEDVLIGKYLDELVKIDNKPKAKIQEISPYLQKLPSSNISFLKAGARNASYPKKKFRIDSAAGSRSNSVVNIQKYAPYAAPISNRSNSKIINIDDPAFFNSTTSMHNFCLRNRPSSAPIRGSSSKHSIVSVKSRNFNKYQTFMIKATAYKNGCRDISANISAKNINEFLKIATDRLQFNRAARRLFLENGDEIKNENQFLKNSTVYVSCGEEFKDPFLKERNFLEKQKSLVWTSDGLQFINLEKQRELQRQFDDDKKSSTPVKYEKHDRYLRNTRLTKRLVVYSNGVDFNPSQIVFEYLNTNARNDLNEEEITKMEKSYLDDFLDSCTNKTNLNGIAKCVYNWHGELVTSLNDVPLLDKCLQSLVHEVEHAPVWVSKGEGFDCNGSIAFLENLIKYTKKIRKETLVNRKKMNKQIERLNQESNNEKISRRIVEFKMNLENFDSDIKNYEASITNLEEILSNVRTMSKSTLFNHIKELNTDEKIFGGRSSKGVKLTVCINGTDRSFEMFFNTKDWSSTENRIYLLLEEVNKIYYRNFGYANKFTRVFNDNGEEIKLIQKLESKDVIWVSQGENWRGKIDAVMAVSLSFGNLLVMNNNEQNFSTSNQNNTEPEIDEKKSDKEEIVEDSTSDSDIDEDLKNFFRKKSTLAKKKTNASQIISKEFKSSYEPQINLKTYIEPINSILLKKYDRPEFWDVLNENDSLEILKDAAMDFNQEILKTNEEIKEIDLKKVFNLIIQNNQEENILLAPMLKVSEKEKKNSSKMDSVWFHDFQLWKFSRSGLIYNQFFPKICLTLDTSKVVRLELTVKIKSADKKSKKHQEQQNETIIKNGYAVILATRDLKETADNFKETHQQWTFNRFGNIITKCLNEQMVLTSADKLLKELNSVHQQNGNLERYELKYSESSSENFVELNSDQVGLFVLEKFETNTFSASQRWAIKQEHSRSIGDWRYSELSTALWHKLAYTWPVDHEEKLIEQFKWPLSGYLIAGAPPLKNLKNTEENFTSRLRVLKNGTTDLNTAISLTRTNAKHFLKDYLHCSDLTPKQFEFNSFLNICTTSLNLPNAARRLFDQKGVEHFELGNLKNEEYVYVSCGEAWIDPKQVKDEQSKKLILTNLCDDLNKILYLLKLKNCKNFVIETSGLSIQDGAKLILGHCCLSECQIERIKQGESIQNVIEVDVKEEELNGVEKKKSAHAISHERTEALYMQKFRWPWEVVVNKSMENVFEKKKEENETQEENGDPDGLSKSQSFDQELGERFKPKPRKNIKNRKYSSQKFAYNKMHGFIYSIDNPNFVFGVHDIESTQSEVVLMKKNEDNINQRWIYRSDGTFACKARSSFVLTVKIPPIENSDIDINLLDADPKYMQKSIIKGSQITVQQLIDFENGNAHQKWMVDEEIGFIYAFATNSENIDITAANKAGICSYYVSYDKEVSQNGYCCEFVVENKNQSGQGTFKIEKNLVCLSCATATRGKFRLTKLSNKKNFSCFIGKSSDKKLKNNDGFKFLHEKVDLSSAEIENTFLSWYLKLVGWRKDTNAKTVLNELSCSKNITIVKILAYKNGDGWTKPGELIVSSSVNGLLEQATSKLQMTQAARRLYTQDGTIIFDVSDLVTWMVDFYRNQLQKNESNHQFQANSNRSADTKTLLDKVDFNEEQIKENSQNLFEGSSIIQSSKNSKFFGPTKNDIRRILNQYDRTGKVDKKKLLKWPVEIWVSCGEQFIPPKLRNKIESEKMAQREQIDKAEHELKIQTHLLRQMTGRRYNASNYGEYKAVKNPDYPVVKEGHWSEIPYEEQLKQAQVNMLKNYVEEIKSPQKKKANKFIQKSNKQYGSHPITKRMLIYVNGEPHGKAIYCWASNMSELNETAKIKLNLTKSIKFFFTQKGQIISRFEDIVRDQLVCVSTGREFISPEQRNKNVEIKANWNRTQKEEGFEATNLKVTSNRNPIIDVDPFGPPLLNNLKKRTVLHMLEYKDNIDSNEQEKEKIASRPKTASHTKSRRPKSKSKSPKRVQISTDPKDLPTINDKNEFNKSEDVENSIYSNDSFIEEDVLNLLD